MPIRILGRVERERKTIFHLQCRQRRFGMRGIADTTHFRGDYLLLKAQLVIDFQESKSYKFKGFVQGFWRVWPTASLRHYAFNFLPATAFRREGRNAQFNYPSKLFKASFQAQLVRFFAPGMSSFALGMTAVDGSLRDLDFGGGN